MISRSNVLSKFKDFSRVAAPILYLHDDEAYEDALGIVEYLMELVGEDTTKPENLLIALLGQAIKIYESCDEETRLFEKDVSDDKSDTAVLRFLIDQHHLTLSDFPEIGHKSLLSKILSGERNMTKSHIDKLSKRFNLDPSLFFG